MSRALSASLSLALLVAGCDSQELRSPECDQGQPVVASGKLLLDGAYSEADARRVEVELSVETTLGGVETRVVGGAALEEPPEFPLDFTLCADLGELSPESRVYASVKVSRGTLMNPVRSVFWIPYEGTTREDLELTVGEAEYWGPYGRAAVR